MKKLNLNSRIRVKLTDYGKDIYYHRFDELNEYIKQAGGKPFKPDYPVVDKDGYSEFPLWKFIELYGPHIHMAAENVIEPLNIYIDDFDLEDAKGDTL